MAFPAEGVQLFYMGIYGGFGMDPGYAADAFLSLATGRVLGSNPPYGVSDFLAIYPKFFGPATTVNGTLSAGSPIITSPSSTTGAAAGQLITGPGIPAPSLVLSVAIGQTPSITITADATESGAVAASIYQAPMIPLAVLQVYVNLAQASILQPRWREMWPLAMALYIAHYATLWMQAETGPNCTAAQVATSGLQQGIMLSQAAGDVSATTQPVQGFDDWGSLNLTQYGIQLASWAQVIGAGMIYIR